MRSVLSMLGCVLLMGCEPSYLPKPRAYPRMLLPEAHYRCLPDTFPYVFEYALGAEIRPDSSWMAEPYWIHLYYPDFEASLQLTYKPVKKSKRLLYEYLEDTYRLTAKHQVKAYSIEEQKLMLPQGGAVSLIRLRGEVPTPLQFHLTDSLHHFLRGALYFRTAIKNDSLLPVVRYLGKDVLHLLHTFRWREVE